jgi:pimeloyl-ACP methyl ester carboxylesterase
MQRLAHRIYAPVAAPHVLSSTGIVQTATLSPVHLVFMHGLMGSHRNFASVCIAMSGAQSEESMKSEVEEEMKRVTVPADCDEVAGCCPHLPVAGAPRVYQCVAFDWRNHGDSEHNANMTMDGLAEDVTSFLADYAAASRAAPTTSSNAGTATSPVPLILVAHSMGALGVLHWMWTAHLRQWRDHVLASGYGALRPAKGRASTEHTFSSNTVSLFSNPAYRVIGAVILDTAPAERPASFQGTKRLIRSLPSIPLATLDTRADVEHWMLKNGPKDVCTPNHIWLLRYQLSNLTFPKNGPPTWKIGLQEIIHGLDHISWRSGGDSCDAILREVEKLAVSQHLPTPAPPPLDEFPAFFLFGATSPYDTPATRAAVRRIFKSPCIVEMDDAGHFLFVQQKRTFVATLQNMCYALEKARGLV